MDEVDACLIEILTKNSQVSFRKIAKETGLSTDTIMRRYQKLEKEGVIQPTIRVDLLKLGFDALVTLELKITSQSNLSTVIDAVAEIPNVIAVIRATGEYDLLLIAVIQNVRHTFEIGEEISRVEGVRKVSLGHLMVPFTNENASFPPYSWHNLNVNTFEK